MPVSRRKLFWMTNLIPLLLLMVHPAAAQSPFAESSLPADTVVRDSFQAGAGLPVGKIQSVRGKGIIFHNDPSVGYRVRTGLPLYKGDSVHTGQDSLVLCRLIDGSRFALGPGSALTILQSTAKTVRRSSLSFLSLRKGGARFYANGGSDPSAFEFKVLTEKAFIKAKAADFIVEADPGSTEITSLGQSRIEVTDLANPEMIQFLSDFQRTFIGPASSSPVVETLSPSDAEVLMGKYRFAPDSKLFASGVGSDPEPAAADATPEEE